MEQLPYIDEHDISVDARPGDVWSALLSLTCRNPADPSTVQMPFFELDDVAPMQRLALKGHHPFAVYRLVFMLVEETPQRNRLVARTWADFPHVSGKLYRALVIGTGLHRLALRRMLKEIAAEAHRRGLDSVRCSG